MTCRTRVGPPRLRPRSLSSSRSRSLGGTGCSGPGALGACEGPAACPRPPGPTLGGDGVLGAGGRGGLCAVAARVLQGVPAALLVLQAQAAGQHHGQVTGRRGHLLTVLGVVRLQAEALLPASPSARTAGSPQQAEQSELALRPLAWPPEADLGVKEGPWLGCPGNCRLPWLRWWQGTCGVAGPPLHWGPGCPRQPGLALCLGGAPLGPSSVAGCCLRAARGSRPWPSPAGHGQGGPHCC